MNVKIKIKGRLDDLEAGLKSGRHTGGEIEQAEMAMLLSSVAKFYSALTDEERDFVNSARMAIEDGVPWR